jgi:hypothetical protein
MSNVNVHSAACDCSEHYEPCAQGHLMTYHRVTNEPVVCQRCGKTIEQIEEEQR